MQIQEAIGETISPEPVGEGELVPEMGAYGYARTATKRVHILRWRPPIYPGEDVMVVETLGILPELYIGAVLGRPGPGSVVYGTAYPRSTSTEEPKVFYAEGGIVTFVPTTPISGGATAAVFRAPHFDGVGNRFGMVLLGASPDPLPVVWRRDPVTGALGTIAELLPLPVGATHCQVLDAGGTGVAAGMCGAKYNYLEQPADGGERGVLWKIHESGAEAQVVPGTVPSMLTDVTADGVAVGRWLDTEEVVGFPMLFQDGVACDLWRSVAPGSGILAFRRLAGVSDDGSLLMVGVHATHDYLQHATLLPVFAPMALSGPKPATPGAPAVLTVTGLSGSHDRWLYVSGDSPEAWTSWSVPECPGVQLPFDPVGAPTPPTTTSGDTSTFAWTPPANGVYPMWARVVDHTTCVASQTHPLVVLD